MIEGIIEEGQEIMKEYKSSPALDAGLLSAAQSVEHYAISRYGTLRTWAEAMGLGRARTLLQQTLDEEIATDGALTELAEFGCQSGGAGHGRLSPKDGGGRKGGAHLQLANEVNRVRTRMWREHQEGGHFPMVA